MTITKSQLEFIEEALQTAKREIEELEYELDWYVAKVPDMLDQALEILEGIRQDAT